MFCLAALNRCLRLHFFKSVMYCAKHKTRQMPVHIRRKDRQEHDGLTPNTTVL